MSAIAAANAQQKKEAPSAIAGPILAELKAAAATKLKDPYSAQFERMRRATVPNVRGEPTDVICGFVNAKNSYGAYAGAAPFIYFVRDKDFNIQRAGDAADTVVMPAMLKTFCSGLL